MPPCAAASRGGAGGTLGCACGARLRLVLGRGDDQPIRCRGLRTSAPPRLAAGSASISDSDLLTTQQASTILRAFDVSVRHMSMLPDLNTKLVTDYDHVSTFQYTPTNGPPGFVYTHSVVLRNVGTVPVANIRMQPVRVRQRSAAPGAGQRRNARCVQAIAARGLTYGRGTGDHLACFVELRLHL